MQAYVLYYPRNQSGGGLFLRRGGGNRGFCDYSNVHNHDNGYRPEKEITAPT